MFSKRLKHLVYKHMYVGSVPAWVDVAIQEALPRLREHLLLNKAWKTNEYPRNY